MNWFNKLKPAWRLGIAGVTLVILPVSQAWGISSGMLLLGVFFLFAALAVAAVDG